jgi:hypothetical protein
MARRVAHHRARRPAEWGCVEETLHLAATPARTGGTGHLPAGRLPDPVAVQPALRRPGGARPKPAKPSTARCSANKPRP